MTAAMRALGVDLGSKHIGVALSDALLLTAQPLCSLPRKDDAADTRAVAALAKENEADTVVIGLPLDLSGAVGPNARRAQRFADALRGQFEGAIALWDERFSTAAVQRTLLEADLSRARRKQVVDKVAAAYILQGWLDARQAST
jgi:putative Holliday junction resolvase